MISATQDSLQILHRTMGGPYPLELYCLANACIIVMPKMGKAKDVMRTTNASTGTLSWLSMITNTKNPTIGRMIEA